MSVHTYFASVFPFQNCVNSVSGVFNVSDLTNSVFSVSDIKYSVSFFQAVILVSIIFVYLVVYY